MPFTEDLDAFFDPADFAVAATYDGATAVNVIFDNDYLEQLGEIGGRRPVATGKASDFAANPTGKTLLIGSTTYVIRNIEPTSDGGVVRLVLEKQ